VAIASAGTVEVGFSAEIAQFVAAMRLVRAQFGDVQKTAETTSKSFSKFQSSVKSAFAGLAIGVGIRAVVRATAEAEASAANLENALRSSSAAISLTTDQLQNYATQLQNTSTFGDEAIQDVESLLLSFQGLSGGTVLRATSAVVDLASRLKKDLPTAATLVGKALQDPTKGLTALTRAGVLFSTEQQRTIKTLVDTGNTAKAQSAILTVLEGRFSGAGAAARNNFSGALSAVKNSLDNLLEAKSGLPGATSSLNEMAKTLQDPAVIAGADALFSTLIRGAAGAGTFIASVSGGLAVLGGKGQDAVVNLDDQIRDMKLRRDQILQTPNLSLEFLKKQTEGLDKQISALEAQQRRILQLGEFSPQIAEVKTTVTAIGPRPDTGPGTEAFENNLKSRQALLTASIATMSNELDAFDAAIKERDKKYVEGHKSINDATNQLLDSRVQAYIDATQKEVDATLAAEQAKMQAVVQFEKQKQTMQQATFAAASGLLGALAVKSKAAAKAQIILNRGLMIAQAVQNTAAAVTGALASLPYPANLAAAAHVQLLGSIQVGLIAATGALELGNVSSGNAGGIGGTTLGTPSNPLPVAPTSTGASTGRVINLNLNGPIAGPEASQWLIDAIGDLINGNDTIIINGNSRQAAEIRGG